MDPLPPGEVLNPGGLRETEMSMHGRDLVSIRDLSREEIEQLLASARKMIPVAEGSKVISPLADKIIAMAFFEPSTRTRLSFEAAVQRLGGRCLTIADAGATSMRKGESLYDTIRMLSSYADAIVIRHPNEGAARLAARASERPVINRRGRRGPAPHPDAPRSRDDAGVVLDAHRAQGRSAGGSQVRSDRPLARLRARPVRLRDRPLFSPFVAPSRGASGRAATDGCPGLGRGGPEEGGCRRGRPLRDPNPEGTIHRRERVPAGRR